MDYTSIAHQHHHHRHLRNSRQDHRHPSFSSTLLDQIYNSIDDSSPLSIKTKKQNQNQQNRTTSNRREIDYNLNDNRRGIGYVRSRTNNRIIQPILSKNSSSSSSDSTGFSSSESDSFYKRSKSVPHPKPIRTTVVEQQQNHPKQQHHQGSFIRTKSRASKIYSDLKKVKQPISPGGRIATFLNSIFTGNNTKKLNKINTGSASSTTCSSASSFSRSCLSKTPSSSEKSKRSVRFIDELEQFKPNEIRVMEENRRVIEAAKELLRNYHKNKDVEDDEEEEEDEDLFELDHLSVIGIEKFREELPVYETTRLNTNRIISR